MLEDCVVKEFKLYDKEAESAAREIKSLANDGYNVSVHYSAANIGGVLIVATKEANNPVSTHAETSPADKQRKAAKKKETVAD